MSEPLTMGQLAFLKRAGGDMVRLPLRDEDLPHATWASQHGLVVLEDGFLRLTDAGVVQVVTRRGVSEDEPGGPSPRARARNAVLLLDIANAVESLESLMTPTAQEAAVEFRGALLEEAAVWRRGGRHA